MNVSADELKPAKKSGKISDKKKRALKISALSVVFLAATAYSVYKNGVFGTVKNLLTLVVCAFLGYAAFYLVVLVFRAALRKRRKRKLSKAKPIVRDENSASALVYGEGEFNYDKKLTPLENLKLAGGKALAIVKKASQKSVKKVKKYYFVSFTLYDAIDVFDDTIDKLYDKVDGIFGLIKMQNKPLGFLEKSLENALTQEDAEKAEPKKESGLKKAIKEKGMSVAITLLKKQINAQINDLLLFVATEAVFVFEYSGGSGAGVSAVKNLSGGAADVKEIEPQALPSDARETSVAEVIDGVAATDVRVSDGAKKDKKKKVKKIKKVKGGEND